MLVANIKIEKPLKYQRRLGLGGGGPGVAVLGWGRVGQWLRRLQFSGHAPYKARPLCRSHYNKASILGFAREQSSILNPRPLRLR